MTFTVDNALLWIRIKALYCVDVLIWFYNWSQFQYLSWLDLCGMTTVADMRCVFYTYQGQRYLVPLPRVRGPARRFPRLEEYFKNTPDTMVALMGPNNDWHGLGESLEKTLGLEEPESPNEIVHTGINLAENPSDPKVVDEMVVPTGVSIEDHCNEMEKELEENGSVYREFPVEEGLIRVRLGNATVPKNEKPYFEGPVRVGDNPCTDACEMAVDSCGNPHPDAQSDEIFDRANEL